MAEGTPGPILNIVGEKVALGPLRRDLLHQNLAWINDFEVARTIGWSEMRPVTAETEEAWYGSRSGRDSGVTFCVYELGTVRPIGTTGLSEISHAKRTGSLGVTIGDALLTIGKTL